MKLAELRTRLEGIGYHNIEIDGNRYGTASRLNMRHSFMLIEKPGEIRAYFYRAVTM